MLSSLEKWSNKRNCKYDKIIKKLYVLIFAQLKKLYVIVIIIMSDTMIKIYYILYKFVNISSN